MDLEEGGRSPAEGPGGRGTPAGPGGGGGMPAMGGGMMAGSKPRFRALLKDTQCVKGHIVDLKLCPRVPMNPKFWFYHVDES